MSVYLSRVVFQAALYQKHQNTGKNCGTVLCNKKPIAAQRGIRQANGSTKRAVLSMRHGLLKRKKIKKSKHPANHYDTFSVAASEIIVVGSH